MDFDGVNNIVCDAEESDWLDISYSERNYVEQEPQPARSKRASIRLRMSKPIKIAAIALLCAALLAALLFVDGKLARDVFQTARAAFSSTLFDSSEQQVTAAITIPSNLELVDVAEGVATFNGGRAALSFTSGTVKAVGEGTITVAMDDATDLVYSRLTDIYVAEGDSVSVNSLLAKYSESFDVTVCIGGETVDVVGSEAQLTWSV